jgi:hypothetical protein
MARVASGSGRSRRGPGLARTRLYGRLTDSGARGFSLNIQVDQVCLAEKRAQFEMEMVAKLASQD